MDNTTQTVQKAPSPGQTERIRNQRVYVPKVDIYETAEAIVLLADLPGVDEKSVDMTLENNVLSLVGRVEPETIPGHRITYAEYDVGDFERAFTLSDEVDHDRIEAQVKNGVLRVVMPKADKLKARKIAIKAD